MELQKTKIRNNTEYTGFLVLINNNAEIIRRLLKKSKNIWINENDIIDCFLNWILKKSILTRIIKSIILVKKLTIY